MWMDAPARLDRDHDTRRDRGSRFFRFFFVFASRRTHLMHEDENETRGVTTDGHARRWSGASPKVIHRVGGFFPIDGFQGVPKGGYR